MLLAGLLLLTAAPPDSGCRISLRAAADGSFAQAGYDLSRAHLARLAELTRERFAGAARRLCSVGVLRPADLARFREIVVQNGEGATEPVIYREPGMVPGAWVFQYAFQEGGPPGPAAFEQALRCWKRPQTEGCYED